MNDRLRKKAGGFPSLPGVYLMKGSRGEVLYVGKAKQLRSRVLSYFRAGGDGRRSIPFLLAKVRDVEYVVTETEKEALLLENNLIKKHRPAYNICFRDDKSYYHLRLDFRDDFPRPTLVRRPRADGARYFGPYSSSRSLKASLAFLRKIFPFRSCRDAIFRHRTRPCLFHQTDRCPAPCLGLISPQAYAENLEGLVRVLSGKHRQLRRRLERDISTAAQSLDFERAAVLRDRLAALAELSSEQVATRVRPSDSDVFAWAVGQGGSAFHVLRLEKGRIVDSVSVCGEAEVPDPAESLESFLLQFYLTRRIPPAIILPQPLAEGSPVPEILKERRGKSLHFQQPRRGPKLRLLELAARNARHALLEAAGGARRAALLEELQQRLHLKNYPSRLECYDVSNLGGRDPVASLVVFRDGEKDPGEYRHYRIRTVPGADDYAMMREVLARRFREGGSSPPDLIVLDGGKGQLNAGLEILADLGVDRPDLIALAKEKRRGSKRVYDRVFLPGRKNPAGLRPGSSALRLLCRARDEAHRFAVSQHRRLRRRRTLKSPFREIPGVGPVLDGRIRARFGSTAAVAGASPRDLTVIPGITPALAEAIVAFCRKAGTKEHSAG